MDRHQFVKDLIAKRDALRDQKDDLSRQIAKAKARTKEAVLSFSGSSLLSVSDGYGSLTGSICNPVPEAERVSDDAIQALCVEIGRLEGVITSLQRELADYKAQDFVGYLKSLLSM